MSGALVIPSSVQASAIEGYLPEIATGAQGWYRPGVDAATAIVNRIPGKPALTVGGSGTIVYEEAYATLASSLQAGGAARFDTGIAEAATMTIAALVRTTSLGSVVAEQPAFIANHGTLTGFGATLVGAFLYVANSGGDTTGPAVGVDFRASYDNSGTPTFKRGQLVIPDPTNWMLLIGVVEAGVGVTLYEMLRGLSDTDATALPRLPNTDRTLWLGDSQTNGIGGTCDMAAAMIRHGAAGADERQAIMMQMLEEAAARGLDIE